MTDPVHEYHHLGGNWRLVQDSFKLSLIAPFTRIQLPLLSLREHSETQQAGNISQIYQCHEGWQIQIRVEHRRGAQIFCLELQGSDVNISFPDAPPALCVDLLEWLAASAELVA